MCRTHLGMWDCHQWNSWPKEPPFRVQKHENQPRYAQDSLKTGFFFGTPCIYSTLKFFWIFSYQISICLSNLMLTGSAVPYLHNGIMSADVNDATNFEVKHLITRSSSTKDLLVWRWKGWNNWQKWDWISSMGHKWRNYSGGKCWVKVEDSSLANLGYLHQWQLGSPLQPK